MLFEASYEGSVSADPEEPTAGTVAGLLGVGLLVRADDGTAVLADDVRYSLRLADANEAAWLSPTRHAACHNCSFSNLPVTGPAGGGWRGA